MKVAIFTDTFLPQINGVTKTLDRLLKFFEECNIDYRVFAPLDGNEIYNNKIIHFFSFRFFLYPECRVSLPNYISIIEKLNDFKPDLIHIITPFNIGLCGLSYAKSNHIPLVSSYHTNIPQYLEYFNLKLLENVSWNFFKWFHNQCDKNYCPSQTTLDLLKSKGIENLEIWGRGIDIEKFSPELRDHDYRKELHIQNKIVILYVGRMSPEKDLDEFMEVVEKLNGKYENKIHFLMVGDGPMLGQLKIDAPQNMTFTGFMHGKELSKLYASSDVFFFPSSTETYGNVILEAMASGLSVVACDAGGVSQNLKDGYNSLACGIRNVDEFYRALESVITNADLRKELGENGRQYTLQMGWREIFQKLTASYEQVIRFKQYIQKDKRTA